jgi:hypothetical protein
MSRSAATSGTGSGGGSFDTPCGAFTGVTGERLLGYRHKQVVGLCVL